MEECKVLLLKDAVYFLNKNLNPEALKMEKFENIMRLIELSDLEIYIHDKALVNAGLDFNDLILQNNLKIIKTKEIVQLILNSEMSFKY